MKYEYAFLDVTDAVQGMPDSATIVGKITSDEPFAHLQRDNVVRIENGPQAWIIDRLSMSLGQVKNGGQGIIQVAVFVKSK